MFCIFSILVFQSPLVGVGSSYLVISLCCLGQLPSWMTGTSLVGKQSGVCCSPGSRGRSAPAPWGPRALKDATASGKEERWFW